MRDETEGFGFTKQDFESHRKAHRTLQNSRILPEGTNLFDALQDTKDDETMKLVYEVLDGQL